MGSTQAIGDAFVMAILAGVVLNTSAFGVVVLLVVHLSLALGSPRRPRSWKRLAISWWAIGLLAFLGAAILIAPTRPAQERGLDGVFLVAPLFAALMGGLAAWAGAHAERAAPAFRRARAANIANPALVLVSGVVGTLWAWLVYTDRRAQAVTEDADARAREIRAAADELARLDDVAAKLEEERAALERDRVQAEAARQRCRDVASALAGPARAGDGAALFVPLDDTEDPRAADAESDAILRRLVDGTLTQEDVGPDDPLLPCLAEERDAVLGAYARGLSRLELWTLDVRVSPLASEALAHGDLDGAARWELLHHIDGLALAAARRGHADELASASRLCELAKTLDRDPVESRAIFSRGGCRRAARAERRGSERR